MKEKDAFADLAQDLFQELRTALLADPRLRAQLRSWIVQPVRACSIDQDPEQSLFVEAVLGPEWAGYRSR